MKISEKVEWHLNELKTETVNAIKSIIEKAGASAISPTVGIVINDLDEDHGDKISEIHLDGKVTSGEFGNETHLFDLSLDLLVVVLKELELKKFSVLEENQ